jgi:quercetin dioxygenase-like cupin family protein
MKVQPIESHEQQEVRMAGADRVHMRMLIGPKERAPTFHMREFEVAPGGCTPHHQHDFEHEVLVIEGQGVVKSDEGDRPIHSGDVVYIPPNERHQFVAGADTQLRFICLIPAPAGCT